MIVHSAGNGAIGNKDGELTGAINSAIGKIHVNALCGNISIMQASLDGRCGD